MLAAGCHYRQSAKEFAPFTAVQAYFYRFCRDATMEESRTRK
jgi:putative transposase